MPNHSLSFHIKILFWITIVYGIVFISYVYFKESDPKSLQNSFAVKSQTVNYLSYFDPRQFLTPQGLSTPPNSRDQIIEAKLPQISKSLVASLSSNSSDQLSHFGPLFFDPSSIKNCHMKCTILMKDSANQGISVVFFEAAFKNKLLSSNGKAFISGQLSKDRASVFLSLVD